MIACSASLTYRTILSSVFLHLINDRTDKDHIATNREYVVHIEMCVMCRPVLVPAFLTGYAGMTE